MIKFPNSIKNTPKKANGVQMKFSKIVEIIRAKIGKTIVA